jgi:hypothetical protein
MIKKLRHLNRDNEAQVLGLPLYLIIIMIIAVAVIAAVMAMMSDLGTPQKMNAVCDPASFTAQDNATYLNGVYKYEDLDITVRVTRSGGAADPVRDATVILEGGGAISHKKTLEDGTIKLTLSGVEVPANTDKTWISITVKADGYEDYQDGNAVILTN